MIARDIPENSRNASRIFKEASCIQACLVHLCDVILLILKLISNCSILCLQCIYLLLQGCTCKIAQPVGNDELGFYVFPFGTCWNGIAIAKAGRIVLQKLYHFAAPRLIAVLHFPALTEGLKGPLSSLMIQPLPHDLLHSAWKSDLEYKHHSIMAKMC